MLFDSTLRKELARSFGATLVVILTIVITMMLIRMLGLAASGVVAPQDVVLLMGYTALGHLPTILALSLFVAIVVTLARMYRDSEMAIWFASGVALTRFVAPVLRIELAGAAGDRRAGAAGVAVGQPQQRRTARRYEQRSDLSRVAPGAVPDLARRQRVFFIEGSASDTAERPQRLRPRQRRARRVGDLGAQRARMETTATTVSWCSTMASAASRTRQPARRRWPSFARYRSLAGEQTGRSARPRSPKALPTLDLMREPTPRNQGELIWRFGLLFGAVNLVLLAIGLSATNPRRASNWNLLFALLGFVVYYNLINLSQAWVAGGRRRPRRRAAALHGGAFVLALALIWWRDHGTRARVARAACRRAGTRRRRRMRTVRRLLYRDIVWSVVFVAVAFLSLFFFIDFVDELRRHRPHGYTAVHAAASAALLELPGPLLRAGADRVLIGTIYSMARLAQSSEYTILRTGGLGPGRALRLLAALGCSSARHVRRRRLRRAAVSERDAGC